MKAPSIVLAGLESAGKTALFRGLTGLATGEEANFRGSTVVCRACHLAECGCNVVDTPGIRARADSDAAQLALSALQQADAVVLVARGTHAVSEVETLLRELDLAGKRSALAMTFADKAPAEIQPLAALYRERLGIPVVVVNARELDAGARQEVLHAIRQAAPLRSDEAPAEAHAPAVQPGLTWFEHRVVGPVLALLVMALMFALPVYAAYAFASWAQPLVDAAVITPLKAALEGLPAFAAALLTGSYGLLTLGWYSFLWAFPVVLLISLSVAFMEESGLKDRVTAALDPWLRRVGLSGRDLIPVLTGFGCNVVAVMQSRSCSRCTRERCVSMISFGSACSYQIGASLSIFGAAGHPGLFLPYLLALFVTGALHTRLWHGRLSRELVSPLQERAFLQRPSARAMGWRVRAAVKQFLWQAMPVFLLICAVSALLDHVGVIPRAAEWLAPALAWLHLPGEAAPALLFSLLRKDGLLVLNSDGGSMLAALTAGQIFLLVWLASTLASCLVTLWTVKKELGWRAMTSLAGRQALVSLASAWLLSAWWH